jgi:hypothetical protein
MLLFPVHSLLNADKFSNIKFGSELKKWMERVEARWVVAFFAWGFWLVKLLSPADTVCCEIPIQTCVSTWNGETTGRGSQGQGGIIVRFSPHGETSQPPFAIQHRTDVQGRSVSAL